jgi:tetratricopeptide (TPR) repeat protein
VTLGQLGNFELEQGLLDEALATLRAALALTREIGNRRIQAYTLRNLGEALLEHGDVAGARDAFEQALAILRLAPNRRVEAHALGGLAALAVHQGRTADAAGRLDEAEATLRELDDRPLLAELLCIRGLVELARAERTAAHAALAEAEAIAAATHADAGSGLRRRIERPEAGARRLTGPGNARRGRRRATVQPGVRNFLSVGPADGLGFRHGHAGRCSAPPRRAG